MKPETRINVNLEGVLTTEDGVLAAVRVLDLSVSGFRLLSNEPLLSEEKVTLRIGREEILRAKIQWVVGREAGGCFLEPPGEMF